MSQPGNTALDPELAHRLSGKCARCPRPRAPDSDHCSECDAKLKSYRRKSAKARRAKLRTDLKCIACRKSSKRLRCDRCREENRSGIARARRSARRVDHDPRRVDQPRAARAPKGHYKTEVFADGASRTRFVGQSHRGGPTRAEQDAGLVRLVLDARRLLDGFLAVFPDSRSAIDALPRIQRTEAWELLASQLTRSARLQLDVAGALAQTWKVTCAGCGRAHEQEEDE